MSQPCLAKLAAAQNAWLPRVRKALAHVLKTSPERVYLPPTKEYRAALFNWLVWQREFHCSLEYIVEFVRGYFRIHEKAVQRRGKFVTLGVKINTATGLAVRQALRDHISTVYPNSELQAAYNQQMRQRMLGIRATITAPTLANVDEALAAYLHATEIRRELLRTGGRRYSRPWRGNPWR